MRRYPDYKLIFVPGFAGPAPLVRTGSKTESESVAVLGPARKRRRRPALLSHAPVHNRPQSTLCAFADIINSGTDGSLAPSPQMNGNGF